MYEIPARPDIELDQAGHEGVCNQPPQHRICQHSWELSRPDEDDWNEGEGGGGYGTDHIDVAGRRVQDTVPEIEARGKEGRLAAEQHLVGTLQQQNNESPEACQQAEPEDWYNK